MSEIIDLHQPFMRFLREQGLPFIRSRSDRESSTTPGDPDFVVLRGHSALCIEMKTEKGALSDDQKKRHEELNAAGVTVHVVRDIGVAEELVREWQSHVKAEPVATHAKSCFIQNLPGYGDWLFDQSGNPFRKATIADLSQYQRRP